MGRVRTKTIKKAARQAIEKFYSKMSVDFDFNKRVLDDVAEIPTKRIRNKIAGYASILMRRIQKGPVRGISLKLQEAERERRMEFIPVESEFKLENLRLDEDVTRMLENLGYRNLTVTENTRRK